MATQIKITQLTDIGSANLSVTTLLPVVNMAGVPTTQKTTLGNLANVILSQSGGNYAAVGTANIAYSVANAAQPNITSVGTLTSLSVTGNVGLGNVDNVTITGGTANYVLQTDGAGNLSWVAQTGGGNGVPGGNTTEIQFNDAGAFAGNTGFTFNNTTGTLAAPFADVSGVANIIGGGATVATKSVLNVASTFGSNDANDPASAQAVRGRVTGSNLTNTRNYVTGVTGQYLVTGTNASEFIKAGILGVVGDQTTTADGAVVAYLDGDGGLTTANAAYAVSMKNSTPNSGFNYGLDLQFIDLNLGGVTTSTFKQADIRFNNGVKLVANTAGNISINGNLMTSAEVVASGVIQSGTGLTTGGYLSVDGNTDLHNTVVTGNLSATGNITANNLGNISAINVDGSNSNVLYGNGVFAPIAGGNGTYSNSDVATFLAAYGSNTITTTGNVSVGNISTNGTLTIGNATITEINPIVLGFTDDIYVAGDVLSTRLKSNSSYVALSAENGNGTSEWTFNDNGVLTLPQPPANSNSSTSINSIYSNTVSFIDFVSNNSANFIFGTTANHNIVLITGLNENDNRWVLGYDGTLTLAGGNSVIQSIANSSLDPTLPNVSTMTLTPDQNYNSQALVLDPTAPGHIHLRAYAFSNIDEPAANIFLGGEDTAFEVTSGPNNEVRVHSGGNTWTFDNAGNLIFPRDAAGNIDPILSIVSGATPTIVSTDASLAGPANLAIQSNYLNLSGFTGEKITFFPDDGLIATDYDLVLTTNVGGGNTYTWTLDATGNLNLPGNLVIAGNANVFGTNRALIQPANDLPLIALSSGSNGAVSSVWVEDIGNVGTSNIAAVYANPTSGSGIVRIAVGQNGVGSGPNLWDFNANGTLTFPGTPRIDTSTNNFEVQAAEAINFEANTVVNIYTDTGNNAFQWQFGDDGNLTLPTGGQIIVSGGLVSSGASPAPTINGFSITNSVGISGNGNIAGNNISATGNISANNFTGNGGTLSNVATKVEGSWTLASGVNTVNISVPLNGTYAIWVNGNIPNGIVTYTATAVVTNTNVPVLGEQYGWFYELGNALVLTSIPNQFVGTQGVISNASPYLGNTANVFTFGITNNSGNTAVVNYGYTKL